MLISNSALVRETTHEAKEKIFDLSKNRTHDLWIWSFYPRYAEADILYTQTTNYVKQNPYTFYWYPA